MKKLLVILAVVFAVSALFGEKPKFEVIKPAKPLAVKNMSAFVEQKLPAMISLKSPLFKGEIQNSNTISGTAIHRVSWIYNGIPVVGKFTVIKERDGKISNIINGMHDFSIDTEPALSAEQAALVFAKKQFGDSVKNPDFISKLVIIGYGDSYKLAYRLRFRPISPVDGRFFYVDANTGKLLRSGDLIKYATNKAKVYDENPVSTPDPIEVDLLWVGDDAEGKLSAAADEKGLRKVISANCPDLGETFDYYGYTVPRCTVQQLANKEENGSFIYEDWSKGLSYKLDVEDIYPEIALYYHMTKIYDYLAGLGLEEYTELPNHRGTNPIMGVANFQMMTSNGRSITLQPMDNAFFSKYDPYFSEMFYGDFEYSTSDALVFGQGTNADFSYDGDVVYHEFGHGVVDGIAQFEYVGWPDKYGFSNEIMGMNEGMADVFSFIITEDPCLAEYVAKGVGGINLDGKLCLRTTTNQNLVNEDFNGESHNDGLPLVGAHWEIYQKMLDNGFTRDDFARIFLTALMSVPSSEIGYKEWGELMVEAAAESPASALKDDFKQILTDRGYFEEVRARNAMNPTEYFYMGGVGDGYYTASTNTVYIEDEEGQIIEVSPMYVQLYYDVPECIDTLTISGALYSETGDQRNTPKLTALVREGEPVIWDNEDMPSSVKYDTIVESTDRGKWTFTDLKPGKRYYISFINKGAPGLMYSPKAKASWESETECGAPEPDDEGVISDNDEEIDEDGDVTDDDFYNDDESKKEKKSSGCSMTVF
ncbi:hypothetical protein J5681_02150 [bacterium]|nr:hypothetical protein [bacterium]